ncbi:MAG: PglZ domain protein [Acidobacteria bacterium ADurb.Bin051]|jgi:hypothetical protein|nr:MAG: PglZ domain protein [Acidobacteria bacterium ADurb.Bin051]
MHPLHEYVAEQLADKVATRRLVVWYDERAEFVPFVEELRQGATIGSAPVAIELGGQTVHLTEYTGSFFELRTAVEPLVAGERPEPVVLYLPGVARDRRGSVLMELEKAGMTWEPQLRHLARLCLLRNFTLGVVDELLAGDRKVSYADLARAAASHPDAEPPSILRSIFHEERESDGLLTAWLASDARDAEIADKEATRELTKLVKARLGLDLEPTEPLAKLRAIVLRHLLANEFRLDLSCAAPASLDGIVQPSTKDEETAVRLLARRLRTVHAEVYAALADQVEAELGLASVQLPAAALGTIDTFRFEEQALLKHAGELIVAGELETARRLVSERMKSFWLDRDMGRKAQWEAVGRMAELGMIAKRVRDEIDRLSGGVAAWLDAYTSRSGAGWFLLDRAQRRLETWVANLDDEPEERPLAIVRRAYEETVHAMSVGFTRALEAASWTVPGTLHQTQIWSEIVADRPKPVAYFLVDAMRFEMGFELSERLPHSTEIAVRAAVGALPSITPVGMAALMPGASSSFAVIRKANRLGVRIDEAFLPDLKARRDHLKARVPTVVDLSLDELLSLQPSKLEKRLAEAQVVIVRSQEIDHAGETSFTFQARQVMDMVIANLGRAMGKLAAAGVEQAVVTADHGHLFFASDQEEAMRVDPPGGETVEIHRRCWVGRGGATPPGCIRVAASTLGYESDLEFVFPGGAAVFRAGGGLAYHHGGPSLQEIVVPVLTFRTPGRTAPGTSAPGRATHPSVSGLPEVVTNRIFSVKLAFGDQMSITEPSGVFRPLLLAGGRQVGQAGMAIDGELDQVTGCVTIASGQAATVALLLTDDTVDTVRLVILDPATDNELYRSPNDIPVRLGISRP